MADIDFYQDDSEDNPDGGDADDSGLGDEYDSVNPDDLLYPLQKLEKYMDSENIFSRQMVARSLLETVRSVGDNSEDATTVLKAMVKLAQDPEPMVRAELMEQVPHLAMFCQEKAHLFSTPISTYILPTVVKYLIDANNQVRKTSQAALLVLLEQELIDRSDMEEQVCPVIMVLSSSESMDDFRTEAVALMSKIAPLIGRDITERVFMPRFAELCTDAHFHVRKVCAANFGDLCAVVGMENTEEYLLPKFFYLCEDGVWGVRKACAECFMSVSCACTLEVRRNELASLFISLILDQSRWVRMAAFQALGGFISTFADPSITGLYFNEEGILVAGNPDDFPKSENRANDSIDDVFNHSLIEAGGAGSPERPGAAASTPAPSPVKARSEETGAAGEGGNPRPDTPRKAMVVVPSSNPADQTVGFNLTQPADSEPRDGGDKDQSDDRDVVPMETDEETSDPGFLGPAASGGGDPGVTPSQEAGVVTPEHVEVSVEETRAEALEVAQQRRQGAQPEVTPPSSSPESQPSDTTTTSSLSADGSSTSSPVQTGADNPQSGASQSESAPGAAADSDKITSCDGDKRTSSVHSNDDSGVVGNSSVDSTTKDTEVTTSTKGSDVGAESMGADNGTAQPDAPHQGTATRPDNLPVEEFNSFTFWRDPLPEIDIDADLSPDSQRQQREEQEAARAAVLALRAAAAAAGDMGLRDGEAGSAAAQEKPARGEEGKTINEATEAIAALTLDVDSSPVVRVANLVEASAEEEEIVTNIGSTHVLGQHLSETTLTVINGVVKDVGSSTSLSYSPHGSVSEAEHDRENIENLYMSQDVIPQALLDHYLSMTDPARAQTVDTDIARHCAYSFPAVAYTLGRRYWPCLKRLYETLAADMQWKVRRTLAFSIHELAVIVGEENTTRDLVPVFNGFLKDLDEVRIGVLKHLADFLQLLTSEGRRDYLTKLPDFLNTDNNRNWRFREELAGQLTVLIEMYTSSEISEHLLPITLSLAEDKVAEVRHMSFRVLSGMLKRFSAEEEEELAESYMSDVIDRFAQSHKWNRRQIYAQLCFYILEDGSLTSEQFANELLPSLLALGTDPIPNVRISLAKVLAQHIMHSEYFTGTGNPHHEDLLKTIQVLQTDGDRDVRYFVCKAPDSELDIIPNMIPV